MRREVSGQLLWRHFVDDAVFRPTTSHATRVENAASRSYPMGASASGTCSLKARAIFLSWASTVSTLTFRGSRKRWRPLICVRSSSSSIAVGA